MDGQGASLNVGPGPAVHKTLLRDDSLYEYILKTSAYPQEAPGCKAIREATEQKLGGRSRMAVSPDEGLLLRMLVTLIGAKRTIEVGTFTGYSLLCTALALPEDGKVTACDVSREWFSIGEPHIVEAGVRHKVDFREGPALDTLEDLLTTGGADSYDFAFLDADKPNYPKYIELLLKLVRVHGLIAVDNTLWGGRVAHAENEDENTVALRRINEQLGRDDRVESLQLTISDGVTLVRRVK